MSPAAWQMLFMWTASARRGDAQISPRGDLSGSTYPCSVSEDGDASDAPNAHC